MAQQQTDQKKVQHHHGFWLSAFLVVLVVHAFFNVWLVRDALRQEYEQAVVWVLPALFLLALLDIIAALGIWKWKKWGLLLYGVSTLGTIIAGLALTGMMTLVFFYLIPVAILATILGTRWSFFE
jgi:uncharacterized membrane protein YeiB